MSRNPGANVQFQASQIQYQPTQLSVPTPVNSVAPVNTQNARLLLQAMDALGTGFSRLGRVVAQSRSAEVAGAAQIGDVEADEWVQRFKDGMLDDPAESGGETPNANWMQSIYETSVATQIPLGDAMRDAFMTYAEDNAANDMNDRERAAYSNALVAKVLPSAIKWGRETFIKPQYEARRDNVVYAMAFLDIPDLIGVERSRDFTKFATSEIELLNSQGLNDEDDTPKHLMLEAAELAVSEGNYGRGQALLQSVGPVTGDLRATKARVRGALGNLLRTEVSNGLATLLHNTGESTDRYSVMPANLPPELAQLTRAAIDLGEDEALARDLDAALTAWASETEQPTFQQRLNLRVIRDQQSRSGVRLFDEGSRTYAAITRVLSNIDDLQDETLSSQRTRMNFEAENLYSEFIETGGVGGQPKTDAEFASILTEQFGSRGSFYMQKMREQRSKRINQDPSQSAAMSIDFERRIRRSTTQDDRDSIDEEVSTAFAEGRLSAEDLRRVRSTLRVENQFDRLKSSPEILELRADIRNEFITLVTGRYVDEYEKRYDANPDLARMPAGARGVARRLMLDFEDAFDDFRYGDEYMAAIEANDQRKVASLERTFRRNAVQTFLGRNGTVDQAYQTYNANLGTESNR